MHVPDFCVDLVYEAPPDGKARCNQQHPERNALVQITALLFVQVINVLFDLRHTSRGKKTVAFNQL